jgi:hypothetical protein
MNKKCLFLFCIISIAGHTLYGLKTTEYRYGPGGKYGPQPRTPSVFVLDDFQEQRMWVDTKHGNHISAHNNYSVTKSGIKNRPSRVFQHIA